MGKKGEITHKYQLQVTGSERKALVQVISEILGKPAVYRGAPTFAYTIDFCSVDNNGVMSHIDAAAPELLTLLVSELRERGYQPVTETEATVETTEEAASDTTAYVVEMPLAGFSAEAEEKLQKIIASKAPLLKKALGTDELAVVKTEDTIQFPWFTLHGLDGEADAYNRLICAIYKMAKTQKRVTAKERATENEKFAMRLFLVRLGFVGNEYKTARRILLGNLTGNSSWKSGHRPEQAETETATGTTSADNPANEKGAHLMSSNNGFPSRETVERVRQMYPIGCRVELISMNNPYSRLTPGTKGAVRSVDDTGTVFVRWDNGSSLGVVYGVDRIRKL